MVQRITASEAATAQDVKKALLQYASAADAMFLQRFFKTGKGQYGEGDVFMGVRVPNTRKVCKQFRDLPLEEVQKLLDSEVHEHRLAGVILLVGQFRRGTLIQQHVVYDLYMQNVWEGRINNWDIVDSSASYISGPWLRDKPKDVLFKLAESSSVWHRRVAVLSTFTYIDRGQTDTFISLAEKLLHDPHDLMHKAVGWGLREVGKRGNRAVQLTFLDAHAHDMPRTMLRYAIEHLSPEQKQQYMGAGAK